MNFNKIIFLKVWCQWPDETFEEMESTLAVQQVHNNNYYNCNSYNIGEVYISVLLERS